MFLIIYFFLINNFIFQFFLFFPDFLKTFQVFEKKNQNFQKKICFVKKWSFLKTEFYLNFSEFY